MTVGLGVDIATAHARVVAVDDTGTVLSEQSAALPAVAGSDGARTQAPDYLRIVVGLLGLTAASLGPRAVDVDVICLTGTSGTLVPCDRSGRPTGDALLYSDQQAGSEAAALARVGLASSPTSPIARAALLVQRGAELVLNTPDVVHAGLLGEVPPADTSHALKAGIDPVAATWPQQVLDVLNLPEGSLPGLVHPLTTLGTLAPTVARTLGLPRTVAVVAGMTDGCTAQVASGAVSPGESVGVLGTTLVLKAVADHQVAGVGGAVYSHYAPDGAWWAGGASNVGAAGVLEEFGAGTAAARQRLERSAAGSRPDAVRYPLLVKGERFPFSRTEARGFLLGHVHDSGAAYRVLLEGVAFVERLGLEVLAGLGVHPQRHYLAGGAAASPLWSRIRATVLDVPVVRSHNATSGFGAAILALTAASGQPLADVVTRLAGPSADDVVEPLEGERERLNERFGQLRVALEQRGLLDSVAAPDPVPGSVSDSA